MSYKYFSSIRRCNCPKRFQGEHCEIGMAIWTLSWEGGRIRDFRAGEDGLDAEAEETGPGGVGLSVSTLRRRKQDSKFRLSLGYKVRCLPKWVRCR